MKTDNKAESSAEADNSVASYSNSPLPMPRACKAQLDVYKRALAEEEQEETRV